MPNFDKPVGPTCTVCKSPMARRRYWKPWARVQCRKCGAMAELVDYSGGSMTFVFVKGKQQPQHEEGGE